MSEPQRDRVQELFEGAVGLPTEDRSEYLRSASDGDSALRAEVESLLRADASGDGVLRSPLVRDAILNNLRIPERLGHYRIFRRLGSGGMGEVYEAEQENPRRLVALKVARQGLAHTTMQRFQQEGQILGQLNHPGIAQIYESGVDEKGQPFFAMEFVRGMRLDEYVRNKRLSLQERIGLMARICNAVQYAHDLGIVHRDLKPANILVEESGQPKVLDFGIARVTADDLLMSGATETLTGQILGTPNYMSPEQLYGDSAMVDQRADVYALGVILFELVADRSPFSFENKSWTEVTRLVQETDAPRLGQLRPELRGDVESIVARALEKDPAQRYQSARNLSEDLRRLLAHEPVKARPPSALYRFRKFTRRHKALVGGVAATVITLVLGLIGTILFAVGEAQQRTQAEYHEQTALQKKSQAVFQTYRARMAAAVAALSAHDVADAKLQLDSAPVEERGWEWQHLHSRLDDSTLVIPSNTEKSVFLMGAPERLQFGALTNAGLCLMDLEGGGRQVIPMDSERGLHAVAANTRLGFRTAVWLGEKAFVVQDEGGRVLSRVEMPYAKHPQPIAISPDGTRVATHWEEGEWRRIVVFEAATGRQTATCDGHRDGIWSLTFSADGTRLASGGEDRTARVWDVATGKLVATCQGHKGKVLCVMFRPDGLRLLTASSDRSVRQWDAATGRLVEAPYDRHSDEVAAAAYSPDGKLVASAGADRAIRVWQAVGREDVAVLHGHTEAVVCLAFASNGRRLASLSSARIIGHGENAVRIWDVDAMAAFPVLRGHSRAVYPIAFSPDGRQLASGSWDAMVRLWDATTGETCGNLPHPGTVADLAYSPDGTWLVTGNYADDNLRIWNSSTAKLSKVIKGPPGTFRTLTVSSDGKRVATTGYDGRKHFLQICDVDSGERLYAAEGRGLAFSSDGKCLATLDVDEQTVLLLNAKTYERIASFQGHEKKIQGAVFSPNNRFLASYGPDRTIRLWDLETRACQVLRGHTDDIFAAAFHPDGTRLATAGRDRAIWIWNIERGEEVARLRGHTSFVWSLAFNKDGTTLASGSGDSTVRLWDTMPKNRKSTNP